MLLWTGKRINGTKTKPQIRSLMPCYAEFQYWSFALDVLAIRFKMIHKLSLLSFFKCSFPKMSFWEFEQTRFSIIFRINYTIDLKPYPYLIPISSEAPSSGSPVQGNHCILWGFIVSRKVLQISLNPCRMDLAQMGLLSSAPVSRYKETWIKLIQGDLCQVN